MKTILSIQVIATFIWIGSFYLLHIISGEALEPSSGQPAMMICAMLFIPFELFTLLIGSLIALMRS